MDIRNQMKNKKLWQFKNHKSQSLENRVAQDKQKHCLFPFIDYFVCVEFHSFFFNKKHKTNLIETIQPKYVCLFMFCVYGFALSFLFRW